MNRDDFERQFMCVFTPDQRQVDIDKRLTKYYKDSECMTNKQAYVLYREFKKWAMCSGYTHKEINAAKQRCNERDY